ncbi:hypothetical protein ACHAW6_012352 [Cyclotella cf. meneghiniana]
MNAVQNSPVETSPSARTETPTTPAANAHRAPERIVTAASASFDQDFDPPAAASFSTLKRKRANDVSTDIDRHGRDDQRDLPSDDCIEESRCHRGQTIHRIKTGDASDEGKSYSDALLLASLSDEVDASAADAQQGTGIIKNSPQPVTPKDHAAVVTTAETPRRSNVQPQIMSSSIDKPFVLHPKPSPSAHDESDQPIKRYKEDGGAATADVKKVTPDRRNDDVKREETHTAAPLSAHPAPVIYPPTSHGWNAAPTPLTRYSQTHTTHHYPSPYSVPSAYTSRNAHIGPHPASYHGYYPRSPYAYPPSHYPPYPPPHTAADTYRDYTSSSRPTPSASTSIKNPLEQRDAVSTSPLPYRPPAKSHVVPPTHCDDDPWYRGYPPSYGYPPDYPPQEYDARYHTGALSGPPHTHHQQSREYYPTTTSDRSARSQSQPFTVSMDENSPRLDYGLATPSRSAGAGLSHPPPPSTPSGAVHNPPRYQAEYYDSTASDSAAAHHHHHPAIPSSSSFYQESYYSGTMTHPHAPRIRMDDPYEPHPHDLPPREYSTPPPPPAYDHPPTSASWDMPVPAAVSQEGEKKHQFRKGARGMHSEPVLLRKKFSWRNYPELEEYLIANRTEYLRHSALNYTAEQKHFNNRLTEGLLELAAKHNYVFDESCFNFVAVRDRIRCYYKSYVQSSKKRGVIVGFPKTDHRNGSDVGKGQEV